MNDNKHKIRSLAKWREESAEVFRKIGLRPAQYDEILGELADLATQKIIAEQSQFLFNFAEHDAVDLIPMYKAQPRTMRNWRTEYLEARYAAQIGKNIAA